MPVPVGATLGMLGDNLRQRRSALPLGRRRRVAWAKGLGLPRGGPTVLYTGQMWQMVPAINAMSRQLAKYENAGGAWVFAFARSMNRLVNLTPLLARTRAADRAAFDQRLRNIVALLRSAGVEFGYLYEDDLYSGALAYDEGLDRGVERHARYVAARLRARGVRRLITVDPHTTHMLRTIYPKLVPGFDIAVESYLEVLAARAAAAPAPLGEAVTMHDSCLYARAEGVLEPPRRLLAQGGVSLIEPEMAGRLSFCCGGPLETLFPGRSAEVARQRVEQLAARSPRVVTACPLCLANLRRVVPAGVRIDDISDYLVRAYCPSPARA